jgi:hypothetical protein
MSVKVPDVRVLTRGKRDALNLYIARSVRLGRVVELVGPANYELWMLLEWQTDLAAFTERPVVYGNESESTVRVDFWIKPKGAAAYYAILASADCLRRNQSGVVTPTFESNVPDVHSVAGTELRWIPDTYLRDNIVAIRNRKFLMPYATEAALYPQIALRESIQRKVKIRSPISWRNIEASFQSNLRHSVRCELSFLLHKGTLRANIDTDIASDDTAVSLPL